ncbi:MAG: NTP transferase domain-containing protein [Planctomycetes bacterium]|nr:NTP transferase domain-containing protein [Planctomycetota bacterium]
MPDTAVYAVIMAGGSGTRFWPTSRNAFPKQLVRIVGESTMIQATVARMQPLIPPERVLVITTAALADETRRQLPMLKPEHVIAEPVGRDTAACVALAALVIERMSPGGVMILLPADQTISPVDEFQRALAVGIDVARSGALVTYGITPRQPSTGYGYIKVGARVRSADGVSVDRVDRFVEKPDESTARAYLADGGYRWNAGIFTWRADTVLAELRTHCSWLTDALAPLAAAWGTQTFDRTLAEIYQPLKKVSIDFALMEHAKNICVVTGRFAWDDVGSWDSLYDHLDADADGVISRGEVVSIGCANSLLMSQTDQVIAAIGVEGLSVIVTKDAILVVPKGKSQQVKQMVDALKAKGRTDLL